MKKMPWGAGSISGPDANGRYEVRLSLGTMDGKRRRVRERVDSPAAATAMLDDLRSKYGKGTPGKAAPTTVGAYLEKWIAQRERVLEPKSIRNYRFGISLVSSRLGHVRLDRLAHDKLALAIDGLRRDGKGDRTLQVAYDTLRAALNWAVKRDRVLVANPLLSVPRPKAEREIDYLSRDEAKAFLEALKGDRHEALFRLVIAIGLRWGEAAALQWRDVDLEHATLLVTRALKETRAIGKPKSKSSKRRIDLPASIVADLRAHQKRNLQYAKRTGHVFCTENATALHASNLERRVLFPALERAGLRRIRFHDLRHTCAALRLLAGEHPSTIQHLLGHSSIRTTLDIYGHLAPSLSRDSAKRYDELMSDTPKTKARGSS